MRLLHGEDDFEECEEVILAAAEYSWTFAEMKSRFALHHYDDIVDSEDEVPDSNPAAAYTFAEMESRFALFYEDYTIEEDATPSNARAHHLMMGTVSLGDFASGLASLSPDGVTFSKAAVVGTFAALSNR